MVFKRDGCERGLIPRAEILVTLFCIGISKNFISKESLTCVSSQSQSLRCSMPACVQYVLCCYVKCMTCCACEVTCGLVIIPFSISLPKLFTTSPRDSIRFYRMATEPHHRRRVHRNIFRATHTLPCALLNASSQPCVHPHGWSAWAGDYYEGFFFVEREI